MIIAKTIDAKGLSCPLPLLKAKQGLHQVVSGELIRVLTTDAGSVRDFHSFITLTEHRMVEFVEHDTYFQYIIQKA
ncbi:sulfurtransferase TusA family protein [Eionea flava]